MTLVFVQLVVRLFELGKVKLGSNPTILFQQNEFPLSERKGRK